MNQGILTVEDVFVERYRIVAEVGHGNCATVYRAIDLRLPRVVALKVLLPRLVTDRASVTVFFSETVHVSHLNHPNIVTIYEIGGYDDLPYLVMQLVPNGTLSDRLADVGPFPSEETIYMVNQLANALDYAHHRSIIHQNLKPSNILFDEFGQILLSDFFTIKPSGVLGIPLNADTAAYTSPEQFQGNKDLDVQSNVYSLGAILFHTLTGQTPYQADNALALALKHIEEPVPSILAVRPDLPHFWERIINRAMAKDRAERFATVGEMAIALNQFSQVSQVSFMSAGLPASAVPRARAGLPASTVPQARENQILKIITAITAIVGLSVTVTGTFIKVVENPLVAISIIVASVAFIGGIILTYLPFIKVQDEVGFYRSSYAKERYFPKRYKYSKKLRGISFLMGVVCIVGAIMFVFLAHSLSPGRINTTLVSPVTTPALTGTHNPTVTP